MSSIRHKLFTAVILTWSLHNLFAQSDKQFIFTQEQGVSHSLLDPVDIIGRFSPSINEVTMVDSLAYIYLKQIDSDRTGNTKWADTFYAHYRQYAGYYDKHSDRIVFINCLCQPMEEWTKYLIEAAGGGQCFFQLKVNLPEKTVIQFSYNSTK